MLELACADLEHRLEHWIDDIPANPPDQKEKMAAMLVAARRHSISALFDLGKILWDEGNNPEDAMILLKGAAEAGHLRAEEFLARIYGPEGASFAEPHEELYWLRRTARGGKLEAMYTLAIRLDDCGKWEECIQWLKVASKFCHTGAQLLLGVWFLDHQTEAERIEGLKWLLRVAAKGEERASDRLDQEFPGWREWCQPDILAVDEIKTFDDLARIDMGILKKAIRSTKRRVRVAALNDASQEIRERCFSAFSTEDCEQMVSAMLDANISCERAERARRSIIRTVVERAKTLPDEDDLEREWEMMLGSGVKGRWC